MRYPLMAVMLLWAFTLPGQEVEVYRFLVKGAVASTTHSLRAEYSGKTTVTEQAVQVFLDAKTSSAIVVNLQQALHNPLLPTACAFPVAQIIADCPVTTAGAILLQQLLAVAVLPNAP
ncbi:hypothetical protein FVR03_00250 [Pontibacter qinzhouensis]|uniref:Uncharacterized protein n=1 Tax=Pontibacter qinzhouensis TaxID=2603253 RepID=A0A5C8KFZ9_9BACT|nr:hypothetical protein [Pontibacter qinzhouensis]TXK52840.1 hypothetical protein FVR03_00250 [Pontibacter qinzhouensis]